MRLILYVIVLRVMVSVELEDQVCLDLVICWVRGLERVAASEGLGFMWSGRSLWRAGLRWNLLQWPAGRSDCFRCFTGWLH